MSTKNKGAPQFSLMHYKLTVVEDAQDQRTVDYTMPRNLRVKEELLSKPKKYINDWVTTVIRGWRNMSFVVTDGGRYMNRAGERRDLQLKQTNPRHGMTAWKNWRCTYLNCRDLNKVIPRDQSSLPMPDFLLKTYLIIYADTIKADNHLNPVLWWKQPNKQNTKTRMFFHLFFFLAIKSSDKALLHGSIVKCEGVACIHIIVDDTVTSGRGWSWRWPQSKEKILRSLQIKSSLWQKMIGQRLFSDKTQPGKVKPLQNGKAQWELQMQNVADGTLSDHRGILQQQRGNQQEKHSGQKSQVPSCQQHSGCTQQLLVHSTTVTATDSSNLGNTVMRHWMLCYGAHAQGTYLKDHKSNSQHLGQKLKTAIAVLRDAPYVRDVHKIMSTYKWVIQHLPHTDGLTRSCQHCYCHRFLECCEWKRLQNWRCIHPAIECSALFIVKKSS